MSVYFVEAVGANRIKIGHAEDPTSRLSQLQTGCPYPLRLLFSIPGGRVVEANYHAKYAHLRIDGLQEWFHFDGCLKELTDASLMYDADEIHEGLPVLRGILTNLTDSWFENEDGKTEQRDAHIQVMCPECGSPHRHGWDLENGFDQLRHKRAHCGPTSSFKEKGYYIGLVRRGGVHCCTPGKAIVRAVRHRERG
jgi:hypothetical protein